MKKWLLALMVATFNLSVMAELTIENQDIRIVFGQAERGYGCLSIINKQNGASFVSPGNRWAGLWRMDMTGIGDSKEYFSIDNGMPAEKRHRFYLKDGKQILELNWLNMNVKDDPNALDIRCEIILPADRGPAEWRLVPTLRSLKYTFNSSVFPLLSNALRSGKDDLLFPSGTFGAQLYKQNTAERWTRYPSCIGQVQYAGVFDPEKGGLYFGIHDGKAALKDIFFTKELDFYVMTGAENIGVAGKSRTMDYTFVIAPCRTPWEAGRIYRKWSIKQQWAAKGKLKDRADIPAEFKDIDLWLNLSGDPEKVENDFFDIAAKIKGRLALHWYNWNVHKFDTNYPEYLPVKPGFAETVKKITATGHLVMPYINGHLWDTSIPSYKTEGIHAAIKDRDGVIPNENYHSGVQLAPMCPCSPFIQRRIAEVCDELSRLGVSGIYFDQIAAMAPSQCFNSAHGHPLGAGNWWTAGYRAMLAPVKAKLGNKIFFATENAAEPYMDYISAFLTWIEVRPTDFPALMQAYSGYATYFCLLSPEADDYQSFVALQSRSLLWGIQPGWMTWLFDPKAQTMDQELKQDYIKKLIAMRRIVREFYSNGELLDEVTITSANPSVNVAWYRVQPGEKFRMPAVNGTIWYSNDNQSIGVMLANVSEEKLPVSFQFNPADYGLVSGNIDATEFTADGKSRKIISLKSFPAKIETELSPRELKVLKFVRP